MEEEFSRKEQILGTKELVGVGGGGGGCLSFVGGGVVQKIIRWIKVCSSATKEH